MRQPLLAVGSFLALLSCACVVSAAGGRSTTKTVSVKLKTMKFTLYVAHKPEEVVLGSGQGVLELGATLIVKSPVSAAMDPKSATIGTASSACFANAAPTKPSDIWGFWCGGSYALKDGSIEGQGILEPNALSNILTVVGGSGKYTGATGTINATFYAPPDGYTYLLEYQMNLVVPIFK